MKLQQLSLFLENRPGRLGAPLEVIAAAGINLMTLSLADTAQFGILRLIVREWEKGKHLGGGKPGPGRTGNSMIGKGGCQNTQDDGNRPAEFRREEEGEQLGFIANFREGDNAGRNKEGFHRMSS